MNNSFIKFPLTLFIVATMCATLIATTYAITQPIIDDRNAELIKTSLNEIYDNVDTYEVIPRESTSEYIVEIYEVKTTDGKTHIVYSTEHIAKGGILGMLIGFDEEGVIDAINYTKFSETPGIGDKVKSPEYTNSIIGQSSSDTQVDGITGATISSTAVSNSVDAASEDYNANYAGGNNE